MINNYINSEIVDIECFELKTIKNIDLIIGGHTHSFLNEPLVIKNSVKKDVLISQVGFGAVKLGKIDFYFEKNILNYSNFKHVFDYKILDVIA